MAAVVTTDRDIAIGQTEHLYELQIAMDASYPTGGELIDVDGNTRFSRIVCSPSGGYVFEFVPSTQKLKAFYGDNNNASDGPLIEVPNTTDLSAITAIQALGTGA